MQFQKATKRQARLRLALIGPSGSGKTYTALTIAPSLGERVAVIDTEHGSASKYADLFTFDTLELDTFGPQTYVEAIKVAEQAGYDVLIIDSLSHAWMGKGGALEQVDQATARSQSRNSYTAWRDVTPVHNALIDAMIQSRCHIIATMRTKTEYVIETNDKGKQAPRKVGLAPIQRDGVEYEFDVVADMTIDNRLVVAKTRCPAINGAVIDRPGVDFGRALAAWLTDGAQPEPPKAEKPKAKPEKPAPPTPPEEPQPANGTRPYQPETVKAKIEAYAQKASAEGWKPAANARNMIAVNMGLCFAGDDQADAKRHVVLEYLTGHASVKTLDDCLVLAVSKWLDARQDDGGAWMPDGMSIREAQAIYNLAGLDKAISG